MPARIRGKTTTGNRAAIVEILVIVSLLLMSKKAPMNQQSRLAPPDVRKGYAFP